MIRTGSALLGVGLLVAGLTVPPTAAARSDGAALAHFLGATADARSGGTAVHVNHHHHHHRAPHRGPSYTAPRHRAPVRILPVYPPPSSKALKKHDAAYRKWEKEHIKLYGHAPRGYPCHHYAPPRHHRGRR